MNPGFSLYLDLLRALAAVAVYIFHAQYFAGKAVPFVGQFGSEAVIVFFVLSGLLISYARKKHEDIQDFMVARCARLWSVCLPALALAIISDTIGQYLSLDAYSPMQPYT
jgi:peptidoglycan/LPS O-acetylase OafA/YrhL